MMSFYSCPKGDFKRIDIYRKTLLWQEDVHTKIYHLVKWEQVCQPRDQARLGVIVANHEYVFVE